MKNYINRLLFVMRLQWAVKTGEIATKAIIKNKINNENHFR